MRMTRMRMLLASGAAALAVTGATATSASADYGQGAFRQIELSANIPGHAGGGAWLWIELSAGGQGDYSGSDCGHAGQGAVSDKGDVSWHYTDSSDTWIEIDGVSLNGFGGFPTTITVPSAVGHYTGSVASYMTLPMPVGDIGFSQLQVAP